MSIFVFILSLIILFFFNAALPAFTSDNPFYLGNFEVEVDSLEEVLGVIQYMISMDIMALQFDVMLMRYYWFLYASFTLFQHFGFMLGFVLMFTASFIVLEWAIGPKLLRRILLLSQIEKEMATGKYGEKTFTGIFRVELGSKARGVTRLGETAASVLRECQSQTSFNH
ncbi:MAG: hypothetical protein ACTSUQ_12145 [Candidatus Freyarchaeota archaeon]